MSIGFIGAGRVGTALGWYLMDQHYPVSGYYSHLFDHAKKAAEQTKSLPYESLLQVLQHSDLIAITTPDDVIAEIVKQCLEMPSALEGKVILHMSGSLSLDILRPLTDAGATVMTLHPLQTIATAELGKEGFKSCYFALEGPENVTEATRLSLKAFRQALNRPTIEVQPGEKRRYHLAAVMASNYLTALMDEALQQLVQCGFTEAEGFKALKPLIMGTLANIEAVGTAEALTGPVMRGDLGTVEGHLAVLDDCTSSKRVYKTMGSSALSLARKNANHNRSKDEALEHLFREGELK